MDEFGSQWESCRKNLFFPSLSSPPSIPPPPKPALWKCSLHPPCAFNPGIMRVATQLEIFKMMLLSLLHTSFQCKRVAGLCTNGRQWGLPDTLSPGMLKLIFCKLTPGQTLCYTFPQFLQWHNAKRSLQLLWDLVFKIPNCILANKDR